MDFVSSPSPNSTNEVLADFKVSTASTQVSTANLSDATMYAFLANQPNGSQLVHEDLEQIHEDDLEEIDFKWQLALLSMRTERFFQKTGMKITINGSDTAGQIRAKLYKGKAGHSHRQLEDQGYFDSGCFRHMTRNISYLTDFKEFDRGYVAFREGAKDRKITSKGTIRTADESHVLLKVPRKNNMYSVDMKNIVPKKDLTCLVAKATNNESML
nr:hypothetical protein [Tanacetum cinerariifolium]